MTEGENLILSEVRESRREFQLGLKELRGDVGRVHDKIDDVNEKTNSRIDNTNEKVHTIDKAAGLNRFKLAAIITGISVIFSSVQVAFMTWIKSKYFIN